MHSGSSFGVVFFWILDTFSPNLYAVHVAVVYNILFLFADSEDRIIVSVKIRIWLFCICTRSDCEFSSGTKKLLKNSSKMLWCGGPMKGYFPLSKISKWYLLTYNVICFGHTYMLGRHVKTKCFVWQKLEQNRLDYHYNSSLT